MGDISIRLRDLSKVYTDGTVAVDRLDLAVERGEFLVLVGPSGCGKSTTLRMIAGLEEITSGELTIDGESAAELDPRERNIAMVFQNFALYPHMTVRENLGFALRIGGKAARAVDRQVRQVSDLLALDEHLDVHPSRLSVGEQQRVAMGRAMIRRPTVFLMDEPLSNLDAKRRVQLRSELLSLIHRVRGTTVYVTHDQAEAMTMGDRVAVMRGGRLQQVGTAKDIYDVPANIFVAAFIGSPRMNLLEAVLRRTSEGDIELGLGPQRVVIPAERVRYPAWMVDDLVDRPIILGLRPEALLLRAESSALAGRTTAAASAGGSTLEGELHHVEFLGHETLLHVGAGTITPALNDVESSGTGHAHPDAVGNQSMIRRAIERISLRLGFAGSRAVVESEPPPLVSHHKGAEGDLIVRVSPTTRLGTGDQLVFDVDLERLHLFDLHGQRLPTLVREDDAVSAEA